ncbi:MAG TPA: hypothetical protein VLJ86_14420 [Ramlibacter sp.]|nr:hypothetical protein [Ramlibacter sp.]
MASTRTLKQIEAAMWALIFLGLFVLALGIATQRVDASLGWSLVVGGGLAAAAGVVLIGVRARMREDSATSSDNSKRNP